MTRHRLTVAQNDDFHTGSGDSYIHATQVPEEANLPFIIGTYHRYDDYIAFLSLKSINSVDTNESTEGLKYALFINRRLKYCT